MVHIFKQFRELIEPGLRNGGHTAVRKLKFPDVIQDIVPEFFKRDAKFPEDHFRFNIKPVIFFNHLKIYMGIAKEVSG
ncbi:hypothetical protein D9M69_591380 [compost metagenome]